MGRRKRIAPDDFDDELERSWAKRRSTQPSSTQGPARVSMNTSATSPALSDSERAAKKAAKKLRQKEKKASAKVAAAQARDDEKKAGEAKERQVRAMQVAEPLS